MDRMKKLFPSQTNKVSPASIRTMKAESQPRHPAAVQAMKHLVAPILMHRKMELVAPIQATKHPVAPIPIVHKVDRETLEVGVGAEATNKYRVQHQKIPAKIAGIFWCLALLLTAFPPRDVPYKMWQLNIFHGVAQFIF